MGMVSKPSDSGVKLVGVVCNDSSEADANYGRDYTITGLTVKPCRKCPGQPTDPGQTGGFTQCGERCTVALLTAALFSNANTSADAWQCSTNFDVTI